jgi:hypothetical protein
VGIFLLADTLHVHAFGAQTGDAGRRTFYPKVTLDVVCERWMVRLRRPQLENINSSRLRQSAIASRAGVVWVTVALFDFDIVDHKDAAVWHASLILFHSYLTANRFLLCFLFARASFPGDFLLFIFGERA